MPRGRAARRPEDCSWHRGSQLGYLAWHEMAESRYRAGERQRLCTACRHWLFAEEWGEPPDGGPRWEDAEEAPAEVDSGDEEGGHVPPAEVPCLPDRVGGEDAAPAQAE